MGRVQMSPPADLDPTDELSESVKVHPYCRANGQGIVSELVPLG